MNGILITSARREHFNHFGYTRMYVKEIYEAKFYIKIYFLPISLDVCIKATLVEIFIVISDNMCIILFIFLLIIKSLHVYKHIFIHRSFLRSNDVFNYLSTNVQFIDPYL